MEDIIMRKQTFIANSNPLSIHRDSRPLAKAKPKIRIIHIFAPEIIKTDVANFRELVQRLTGKPPPSNPDNRHPKTARCTGKRRHRKAPVKFIVGDRDDYESMPLVNLHEKPPMMIARKIEPFHGFTGSSHHEDYLSAFSDIDRFIYDISELPLLPMDPSNHIHSSFEASQLV